MKVFRCPAGTFSETQLWRLLPQYPANLNRARRKSSLGPFYVELFGARYSSIDMANDQKLALAKSWEVSVYVEEDARFGYVVPHAMPERVFPVAISGRYSEMPHTLPWRRAHEAFMRNQKMAARTTLPNSMLGFTHGIVDLAKQDEKAAALLGDVVSFMNRHGRGEVAFAGISAEESARLLDAVAQANVWCEDEESGTALPVPEVPRPRGGIIFGE